VIARQRPGTAKGVTFVLLEDERGTLNVIVPPPLYERRRQVIRCEPLVLVEGRLERHPAGGGGINVLAADVRALDAAAWLHDRGEPVAEVQALRARDPAAPDTAPDATDHAERDTSFQAVAPAVMSFGRGRRR
jgi:error-prone DNA polymerase